MVQPSAWEKKSQNGRNFAACVAFITSHDASPLFAAHGACAAVRKQVNDHIPGLYKKRIVMGLFQNVNAFFATRKMYRLD
jgi:hypothetical protein